ncbi:hypothetical protein FB451DRAFT_512250 [Mycena latifolia]|nr:hypothetical protein FB451DRAFT_512250 [Mycena latifolia]
MTLSLLPTLTMDPSPRGSPTTSPCISPSSSRISPSSARSGADRAPPESEGGSGLASSSSGAGMSFTSILPFDRVGTTALLDRITDLTACGPGDVPVADDFQDFVVEGLTLLRAAAVRIDSLESSSDAAVIQDAVCIYFLPACYRKATKRLATIVSKTYRLDELSGWEPTQRERDASVKSVVKISSPAIHFAFRTVGLHVENNTVVFEGTTADLWWQALVLLLRTLNMGLTESPVNMRDAVHSSVALHTLIMKTPTALWEMSSLGRHLEACHTKGLPSTNYNEGVDAEEGEDDIIESLPPDVPLPGTAALECIVFHRAVDAACAWTTGPIHLLRTSVSRSSMPVTLSIVDLPRAPINAVHSDDLLKHWAAIVQWPPHEVLQVLRILQRARDRDLERTKGACHCEAGLMASLALRLNQTAPLNNAEAEPAILANAFEKMPVQSAIAIGVAKKCCPICRMLGKLLWVKHQIAVELPGQHSRYHPWVPPHWLPLEILQALESELLQVVTRMLQNGMHLVSSRSSSPASASDHSAPADEHKEPTASFQGLVSRAAAKQARRGSV